jgi:hypothetical protein
MTNSLLDTKRTKNTESVRNKTEKIVSSVLSVPKK